MSVLLTCGAVYGIFTISTFSRVNRLLKFSAEVKQFVVIDHKVLSCIATHAAGLIVLTLCYCAHSILVRGVYLDAEEPGASAAVLPYFYTRYFMEVKRTAPCNGYNAQ